jgi:hypothetical protein
MANKEVGIFLWPIRNHNFFLWPIRNLPHRKMLWDYWRIEILYNKLSYLSHIIAMYISLKILKYEQSKLT